MNAVVLAVSLVLTLSLFRVNVILALCLGALAGGVWAGLTFSGDGGCFSKRIKWWRDYCT